MKSADPESLRDFYNSYKGTGDYEQRRMQTSFASLARITIAELLKKEKLTNGDLTALIQMFGAFSSSENYLKYLRKLKLSRGVSEDIEKEYNLLAGQGIRGYTSVGKSAIIGLTPSQLGAVKQFLASVANGNISQIKDAVRSFEAKNIPEVKRGVYTPWLHYLRPDVCPIINGPNKGFLKSIGWTGDYVEAIDFFQELGGIVGEKNLGMIDSIFWKKQIAKRFIDLYKNPPKENKKQKDNPMKTRRSRDLNIILYGAPGTGKTYNTINKALEIIHNDPDYCKGKNRPNLMKEFNNLRDIGQVEFITFHQSYSYEDFVEGIRPVLDSEAIKYELKDGTFKNISRTAQLEYTEPDKQTDFDEKKIDFYKMSLGDTSTSEGEEIYTYCIQNNCISLGWGGNNDYSAIENSTNWDQVKNKFEKLYNPEGSQEKSPYGFRAIFYFKNLIQKNDVVLISNGNFKIRAIGKITGEYEYRKNAMIEHHHFRKVEWLLKDVDIPVESVLKKRLSQQSIYQFYKKDILFDRLKRLLSGKKEDGLLNNYVLIIDEINRGNISRIFGELITLIEPDKRLMAENELKVRLTYSGEEFGVPPNLYLIGTMNTADRSIALVDIALRRRFTFIPVESDPSLVDNADLRGILEALNKNLVKELGSDYVIGHSYFMGKTVDELQYIMDNNVLPLLSEYFYNDNEKIKEMFVGTGIEDRITAVNGVEGDKARLCYKK
jgi:5-methylcytosine-specific restriction protein B